MPSTTDLPANVPNGNSIKIHLTPVMMENGNAREAVDTLTNLSMYLTNPPEIVLNNR